MLHRRPVHRLVAGPRATLLINDYRTDPAYEKVIEQLVDGQGKRMYDVIGIQSHMHGGTWPTRKIWEVCERFARFGVPLHFTETTVLSGERTGRKKRGEPWPSTSEDELDLTGELTKLYDRSYENFIEKGLVANLNDGYGAANVAPEPR